MQNALRIASMCLINQNATVVTAAEERWRPQSLRTLRSSSLKANGFASKSTRSRSSSFLSRNNGKEPETISTGVFG